MNGKFSTKAIALYLVVFVAGLLAGPIANRMITGLHNADPGVALAQSGAQDPGIASPDAPDLSYFVCNPTHVAAFTTRVHVRCNPPLNSTIYYFAYPTSDSKNAARVLSALLTAEAAGKSVAIYYDPSADGSLYGCSGSNCKPLSAVEVIK